MSENFEKAIAIIRSREDLFPLSLNEDFKNRVLAARLQEAGVTCRANTTGQGSDIVGSDFVLEAKNDLLSSSVLHHLEGQVGRYVRQGNPQIGVVIYSNASKSLLDELKNAVSNYYVERLLTVTQKLLSLLQTTACLPGSSRLSHFCNPFLVNATSLPKVPCADVLAYCSVTLYNRDRMKRWKSVSLLKVRRL